MVLMEDNASLTPAWAAQRASIVRDYLKQGKKAVPREVSEKSFERHWSTWHLKWSFLHAVLPFQLEI